MILWSLLFGGKHEDKRVKNLFPTLVATFLLKGGLNQVMFLLLIFFLGSLWWGSFGSWFVLSVGFGEVVNFSSFLCPFSFRALLYGFTASSNNLEFEELLESLNSIPFGRLFMIAGGWLLCGGGLSSS